MEEVVEVLTPEQAEEIIRQKLDGVYRMLVAKRDEWVRHRASTGKENQWRKAATMYEGKDPTEAATAMEDYLRDGPTRRKRAKSRSQVVVNIVAPKVDAVTARMCEILLPVDDRNWGMKPTPDPELSEDIRNEAPMGADPTTGQPVTVADGAKAAQQNAKKAAEAMERKVDDALTECRFNGQQRRQIFEAVLMGTGVIKGPKPSKKTYRRYVKPQDGQGGYGLMEIDEIKPGSEWIPLWNCFPDPSCGNNHQQGSGHFEKREVNRRALRELVGVPGYDPDAIREVLREGPTRVRVAEGKVSREASAQRDLYELWEYHGDIEPEEFGALSIQTGLSDDEGDPLAVSRGVIVIVNDKIIGATEAWSDDLPYDYFVWNEDDDSPFGIGLAQRLETQQRVVNAAWRQVMDNAGLSSGPQLVALKHLITPQDGKWEFTPRKLWMGREELDDARKALAAIDIPNRTADLLKITEVALQFADQESSTPTMMQGDQGSAPNTVGGMTLLMNSANSPLRHKVKLFDDQVTRPHITRYYDFFMATSDEEEIKGDFEVDARGSTALIERDIQNQAMLNVANLTQNPVFGPLLQQKAPQALRAILKSFKVDPDDFVPTDDEIEQDKKAKAQQQQPQDPAVLRAQAMKEAKQIDQQTTQMELTAEQQENERDRELKREQLQAQVAHDRENREIAVAKIISSERVHDATIAHQQQAETLKLEDGRQRFNAEAEIKARLGSGI